MNSKTEIIIDGDNIIYNGVKYEKVKVVPSEQPFKLHCMFADILENMIADFGNYDDVMSNVDLIASNLLEEMRQYIPDYNDWRDALNGHLEENLSYSECKNFRLGWDAYCKKMMNMMDYD